MLKILSWNIQQGGGSRTNKICTHLSNYGADIIILSEYKNNENGLTIRKHLLSKGYLFQNVGAAPSGTNSVAIFSKLPCNQFLFPGSDPEFSNNVICSEFPVFKVYGMYLPHKKKHVLFDFLLEEIKNEKPCLLAGDFNTGINYVDQVGNSFWYTEKLAALAKANYVDAFRLKHNDVKEYSWYSHQGNGYRYDHTYIQNALSPVTKDCFYLHEWREMKLSDHSPMVYVMG